MANYLQNLNLSLLGEKLKHARMARALTQDAVAEKMNLARTTLVAIEKGERRVKARELAALAELYGRKLSEWLGEEPVSAPLVPQFRMPTREMKVSEAAVVAAVDELEGLARDYLALEKLTGFALLRRYPSPYQIDGPGMSADFRGEEVAAAERTRLGLGDGPIHDLRAVLEDEVGLRVFFLELPGMIGGIYAFNEELGGCIAVNRKHPASRGGWSLTHEYGHFLSTRYAADVSLWNGDPWGKSVAERFADAFTKNFLMPRTGVNRMLSETVSNHGKGITAADVLTLAHQFRVSAEAMFRRLEELRRLPVGTWDKLIAQNFQPERARQTLGLVGAGWREAPLPFRYRMLACRAYDDPDSEMTEAELARFLRMDRVAARDELDRLRIAADQGSEDGFEPVNLDPNKVLQAV
jgi:Zn-dependent peptidase ImmA (M78 family)/transcriptional regulator with XRE-family HTH domain